jgi:hypothetical protein
MAKSLESMIKKAHALVDQLLESVKNEIPEVPDESKTAGSDIKKELLGDGKPSEALEEHEDNFMPEVPDESKTAGSDIKKAIATAVNPKVKQPIDTKQSKISNELETGEKPAPVQTSAKQMIKDIVEGTVVKKNR